MRPDLFDPHTVHFHGYPQAAPVFDGMPEGSFGVNMGSSVTYYYKLNDPGTYMYHCHQEATEHMQMGMLGNLYVMPRRMATPRFIRARHKYVYNDGDGSTGYDVGYPLQLTSMDPVFHDASLSINPLPFKNMKDTYAMINGRGYPDTVNTDPAGLPAPAREGRVRQQREFAADSRPDHRDPGQARPAAAVEPERHQLLHGDCTGPSDEGGRSGRA